MPIVKFCILNHHFVALDTLMPQVQPSSTNYPASFPPWTQLHSKTISCVRLSNVSLPCRICSGAGQQPSYISERNTKLLGLVLGLVFCSWCSGYPCRMCPRRSWPWQDLISIPITLSACQDNGMVYTGCASCVENLEGLIACIGSTSLKVYLRGSTDKNNTLLYLFLGDWDGEVKECHGVLTLCPDRDSDLRGRLVKARVFLVSLENSASTDWLYAI